MRKSFDKIKSKYVKLAVIYAVCGGILCALLVTGAVMLALKLCAVVWGWYLYLILGICAGLLAGTAIFFITKPTDMRLARKLDKTYGLDEKTQTMIEYGGQEGVMLDMQRADTEAALSSLPRRKANAADITGIAIKVVALLAAAALFIAAVIVPQRTKVVVPAEEPYVIDEYKLTNLQELTDAVSGDTILNEDAQTAFVTALEALYTNLTQDGLTASREEDYVQDTMYTVSVAAAACNTYDEAAYALSDYAYKETDFNAYAIAVALRGGAAAYSEVNSNLTAYSVLASVNNNLLATIADKHLEPAGETITEAVEELTEENFTDTMNLFVEGLYSALTCEGLSDCQTALTDRFTAYGKKFGNARTFSYNGKSVTVSSGDGLYDAIYDLYRTVNNTNENYSVGYISDLDGAKTNIIGSGSDNDGAVNAFVSAASSALQAQAYTYMADVYVRETLAGTFGVDVVKATVSDGSDISAPSSGSGSGSSGGGGQGDSKYPGQDIIYNPITGEYDYYYYVITDAGDGGTSYLDALYELLASDDISDEMKNYISAYISKLLTTTE